MTCINWTGSVDSKGYGSKRVGTRVVGAHRLAYCAANGLELSDISGLVVRHTCDNRLCVNGDHLITGSYQDNSDDMTSRQRQARGTGHGQHALTEAQVHEIRASLLNQSQLSRHYGVARTTIQNVINRVTWTHI